MEHSVPAIQAAMVNAERQDSTRKRKPYPNLIKTSLDQSNLTAGLSRLAGSERRPSPRGCCLHFVVEGGSSYTEPPQEARAPAGSRGSFRNFRKPEYLKFQGDPILCPYSIV